MKKVIFLILILLITACSPNFVNDYNNPLLKSRADQLYEPLSSNSPKEFVLILGSSTYQEVIWNLTESEDGEVRVPIYEGEHYVFGRTIQ